MDLPATSPDFTRLQHRDREACRLESRIEISPSDEPRTSPGGSEAFEKDGGRSLWMKQVTPASDAPALSRWPLSCWAASTALKRRRPAEYQLLPDNWPTTGRPMLEMPLRQSNRQCVFWMLMLAKLPFVLGTVWSSPWLMPHTCRPSTRTESTFGSTVIMLTRLLCTKYAYLEQLADTSVEGSHAALSCLRERSAHPTTLGSSSLMGLALVQPAAFDHPRSRLLCDPRHLGALWPLEVALEGFN
jgi:hypothetical protein